MSAKITSVQLRRGTKAEWDLANPILLDGEVGFEVDTYRFKIGKRDNFTGNLLNWSDLRYAAPYSGDQKPVYPQTGDFYVESNSPTASSAVIDNPGENLYYWNGEEWIRVAGAVNPIFEGDITLNGPINMEQGCLASDVLPCSDLTFNLGSPEKRWDEIYVGSDDQGKIQFGSFEISVGESSDPESELTRLQLNGEDIVVRSDFRYYTTMDLPLYVQRDEDGDINPMPRGYDLLLDNLRDLTPEPGTGTLDPRYQSGANGWFTENIVNIVGYAPGTGPFTYQPVDNMNFWHKNTFNNEFVAQKGVQTPVTPENITNYDAAPAAASYFHKADGSISDRVPLNQSYWNDVPRLTNSRRR